jgi:hypothetical protein
VGYGESISLSYRDKKNRIQKFRTANEFCTYLISLQNTMRSLLNSEASDSALMIKWAAETEMSLENLRRIFMGHSLPRDSTINKILKIARTNRDETIKILQLLEKIRSFDREDSEKRRAITGDAPRT